MGKKKPNIFWSPYVLKGVSSRSDIRNCLTWFRTDASRWAGTLLEVFRAQSLRKQPVHLETCTSDPSCGFRLMFEKKIFFRLLWCIAAQLRSLNLTAEVSCAGVCVCLWSTCLSSWGKRAKLIWIRSWPKHVCIVPGVENVQVPTTKHGRLYSLLISALLHFSFNSYLLPAVVEQSLNWGE